MMPGTARPPPPPVPVHVKQHEIAEMRDALQRATDELAKNKVRPEVMSVCGPAHTQTHVLTHLRSLLASFPLACHLHQEVMTVERRERKELEGKLEQLWMTEQAHRSTAPLDATLEAVARTTQAAGRAPWFAHSLRGEELDRFRAGNEQRLGPMVDRKLQGVAAELDRLLRELVEQAVQHLTEEIEHSVRFHMQVRKRERRRLSAVRPLPCCLG
eukprot:SAG22_NODE_14_length_33165_cov_13.196698_40_plen_214_part_00